MLDDQLKGYKHRIALYGLGGIGKTQISLEYCFRYKDDYDYIFWLSAMDQTRLLSSFREIAGILTEHGDRISDGSNEEIARAVLRCLGSKNKWLLIFDNLDNIRIADGYLPHTHLSGHVLITTRNKNCHGIPAEGVEINLLNASDSISLLLHRSGLGNDQREEVIIEAQKIVDILGYLPLAIEQAASYIRSTQNIFEYLETYSQNQKDMLLNKPTGNHPYGESIFTTWKTSFRQLERTSPESIPLSRILAFMNPDETLVKFLKAGKAALQPELRRIFENNFLFRQSLHGLEDFSLIRVWDEGRRITIHRLVQDVVRDDLDVVSHASISTQALQLALTAFPAIIHGVNRDLCRTYYPQVTAILDNVEKHTVFPDSTIKDMNYFRLSDRLTSYLYFDGYYSDAVKYCRRCLQISERMVGKEHPNTLRSMNNLAAMYDNMGRLNEAVKVFESCLEIRKRVLGEEHPDTLWSMNGLATTYNSLGRSNEAVKVFEACLEIRKRVLGEEHPDTLWSMSNLAATYDRLGRSNEAVKVNGACLEIRKRVLGEEHPDTLQSMSNLAATYDRLGRSSEAVKVFEACLEIRKRVR